MGELARSLEAEVDAAHKLLGARGVPEKVKLTSTTTTTDGDTKVSEKTSVTLASLWEPQWPVVQPARPVALSQPKPKKRRGKLKTETAVILPDPQIGFRLYDDETLEPFHDDRAMRVALSIAAELNPHRIVNLGDFIDLPAHSKYEQEPAFAFTTQQALDRGHKFLGEQRAAAPDAEIVVIEGNHDRRLHNAIRNNAAASFGIRVANAPESWPVMSLPNLLRMDELGVTYVAGYPAGEYWINDNLVCIHGRKVRSGGSTAAPVAKDEYVSQIFGHTHRSEEYWTTRRDRQGAVEIMAATPGCLCRIDGVVPSLKGSTDVYGRVVRAFEDWQQGLAVVTYEPGNGSFDIERVRIRDGRARFRGQLYVA